MATLILTVLLSIICSVPLRGAEPFCDVRLYGEEDGLSQQLVKGIAQDHDGFLWVATWNGLNRFDGTQFSPVRPAIDDPVYRYSQRLRDVKLSPKGNLWLRIDDNLVYFDIDSLKFRDVHAQIEQIIGRKFEAMTLWPTETGKTLVGIKGGECLIIDEDDILKTTLAPERPKMKLIGPHNRTVGDIGPYDNNDLVFSRKDGRGGAWFIAKDGTIGHSPDLKLVRELGKIDEPVGAFRFGSFDSQGNVWLTSNSGAYCITLGFLPFESITPARESKVRTTFRDSQGRIWMSESDAEAVSVYDSTLSHRKYLNSNGSMSDGFASSGLSVYSFAQTAAGEMLFGCKPGGLYQLGRDGKLSPVAGTESWDVYGITPDSKGRLWIATMGSGLKLIDNGKIVSLLDTKEYPDEADHVRTVSLVGDTLIVAATTAGILTAKITEKGVTDYRLLVSQPGESASLGNIAVSDINVSPWGQLLATTESDGLNYLINPLTDKPSDWHFGHFNTRHGAPTDVASSLSFDPADSSAIVVSNNLIYKVGAGPGECLVFAPADWGSHVRFTDSRPLALSDGRWLVGHNGGALTVDFDSLVPGVAKIFFTSATLGSRPDSLLSATCNHLTVKPDERNLTLKFSALVFPGQKHLRYSYRIGGGDWTDLGQLNSLTLLDLEPGDYDLEVRSTDSFGRPIDNGRKLRLEVVPTFWETTTAKVLYVLITLLIIGGIVYVIFYIRDMKRTLRERREAYLKLLETIPVESRAESLELRDLDSQESPLSPQPSTLSSQISSQPSALSSLSEADTKFMDKVMEFVNTRLSDPEATVDDMAAAVAVSRSGLNRRLKSMIGVSPAEFLRESRLKRASALLSSTQMPIKEVAYECGFSDLNYFGKVFKNSFGVTPTGYRNS